MIAPDPPGGMKIVSVGDRVEAGSYRLHSRFRHAANYLRETAPPPPALRCGGPPSLSFSEAGAASPTALICLVTRSVGPGPIHIVVDGDLPEADTFVVESDALRLGAMRHALSDVPRYDSALPCGPVTGNQIAVLADHLRARSHPKSLAFLLDPTRIPAFRNGFEQNMIRQIREGVDRLLSGDRAQGWSLLRGCGFGLTPSGDDLLAGVMIGWHVVHSDRHPEQSEGSPFPAAVPPWRYLPVLGMTESAPDILSHAFLALAADGRVNETMKQLITALTGTAPEKVRAAADGVLAHGETSGADVLTGLVLALQKGTSTSSNQLPTLNA